MKKYIIDKFGKSWFKSMESYLSSDDFSRLGSIIAQERKKYVIYPSRDDLFKCFTLTPYNNVKIILMGMDPYHDGSADGLAFSNSQSLIISPSLRIMLKEVSNEYPEKEREINYGRLVRQDLTRWAYQGVLLINAAQTVREGEPGSHMKLWSGFTKRVIHSLNNKTDLIWILLGNKAKEFIPEISKQHYILTAPHPASEIYRETGFYGSNIFKKANERLSVLNKKEIEW